MHVAVCIVGFRNPNDILTCLEALALTTHADFEVVICENGGPEAFAVLAARLPRALAGGQSVRAVCAAGNLGYAGGVNVCLKESAGADVWWVLNPDTQPASDAMSQLLARISMGDCEAAGCTVELHGGIVQSHGGQWQRWLARAVSIGNGQGSEGAPIDQKDIERQQNYLNGACMMVSRAFLETVGPMREDYFLYCEEVEWCLRAIQKGVRLGYAPLARVLHEQGTTTGHITDIRQRPRPPIYLNERNRLLLTRDRFPGLTPVVALTALVMIAVKFARRRAWKQVGYALQGWRAGLRGERGVPAFMR